MKNAVLNPENPRTERLLFLLLLCLGLFARLWRFGAVPGGINVDEAFAGYEAYSIQQTGMDTSGHLFPVYLTAWGSGMNALNSYLMIPLIALFGLQTWVIRLPQAIVACLCLPVSYHLVKKTSGVRCALCTLLLLAVCPWHVLLSRWGLESNLAPGFVLFGLYFFALSMEHPWFLPLSAAMYGLSLYTYATLWPVMPFLLLAQGLYALRCGKLPAGKPLVAAIAILAIMAAPLLLFLMVNLGWIDEIRLPFLSIPRLVFWRGSEFSFRSLPGNFKALARLLIFQRDKGIWNSAGRYGLVYFISVPFFLVGFFCALWRAVRSVIDRKFSLDALLVLQLAAGGILGLSIRACVNRVNILFLPIVFLTASGIFDLCHLFRKNLVLPVCCIYLTLFGCFQHYYHTDYSQAIAAKFHVGLEDAISEAMTRDGRICVSADIPYSDVLYYSQIPPDIYRETVRYKETDQPILLPDSFDRFSFVSNSSLTAEAIDRAACYILSADADLTPFEAAGFTIQPCKTCTLLYLYS